jgi:MYXO-CTERM domain-containing protein
MKRTKSMKQMLRRGLSRALVLGPLVFLLVAGAGCPSLFDSSSQRAAQIRQAVPGRDGVRTISAANTVVNAYAVLNASVGAGSTAVTVADVTTLATGFPAALAQGDLLLIVQMAGATIDVTETINYGAVTTATLGNAGRYEFAGVEGVTGNQITLACPLKNAYTATGKVQVIRVPQYTTLTVASGASITAPAWNGLTGGVVALHAETTLQLDGQIDVSAKGFRGGAAHDSRSTTGLAPVFRSADLTTAAEKGEGIAGSQDDYQNTLNGRYGRGAPANGGGGGDSHNAGGGGGANARSGSVWTGQGVMLAVVGAAAWALDPGFIANANARTTSQGGGRGGYSYSNATQNPLAVGPNDASWAGDSRREVGGLGGHPLDNDPAARLFMGGGGGAGDGNNGAAGPGGNGGGLVFVIAGAVAGAGSILANGEGGVNSAGSPGDAPGGGGGGGTVVVHAVSIVGIAVFADGGAGGNHTNSSSDTEVEGPGGGGGGGYVALSGGTLAPSAAGGPGGTTNRAVMSTFPSDGATAGNAGQTNGSAATFLYCGVVPAGDAGDTPNTIIATHPTDPSTSATGVFTFESTEGAVTFECSLNGAAFTACPASYTTPTLLDGSQTIAVRAIDLSGNVDPTPAVFSWTVQLARLDAGTADVEQDSGGAADTAGADGSAVDGVEDSGEAIDVGPIVADAEAEDLSPPLLLDAGAPNLALDTAVVSTPDVLPVFTPDVLPVIVEDAGVDVESVDAFVVLDTARSADVMAVLLDSAEGEVLTDAEATGPAANPDIAPRPEPNPDSAIVVVSALDAAIPVANKDAGPAEKFVVLGSGFCAVASARTSSPMPLALLALAGLALLIRRRR